MNTLQSTIPTETLLYRRRLWHRFNKVLKLFSRIIIQDDVDIPIK